MRQVSREGIELIKRFEGLETQSYQDIAGIWTIGYGHTGPEVGPGMSISEAEAEDLLLRDLGRFERGVSAAVTAQITQTQFDALVSLSYNIGVSALKGSTAIKRLNRGDIEGAAEAMTWWNKATVNGKKRPVLGLTRRRSAEAALFLSDVSDAGIHERGVVVEENSPRRSNPMNSRTVGGATTAGAAGAAGAGSIVMGNRDGENDDDGPVVIEGDTVSGTDADPGDAANAPHSGKNTTGEQTVTDQPQIASTGCYDRDSGEYLTPAEAAAGEPLSPGGPIDADAAPRALEVIEVPFCAELELAETGEIVEQPDPMPTERDTFDAMGIGAGALAVLAALYTIGARVDDWLKFRR